MIVSVEILRGVNQYLHNNKFFNQEQVANHQS